MNQFLSCDWGTSSLRVRLADAVHGTILVEESSGKGIAHTFTAWKETGKDDPEQRLLFYLDIVAADIKKIEDRLGSSLQGIPLVISGMACSSIGMINLPYQPLPFAVDGSSALTVYLAANDRCANPVLLISGVKSGEDVMRGEETQLVGCITGETDVEGGQLFIFPGTHSKHIMVRNQQIASFTTYMTGEFFDLLSNKSVLQAGIEKNDDLQTNARSFQQGVTDGIGANLLHAAFRVRTNDLLGIFTKKENFNYLSGLLIGAELQGIKNTKAGRIFICCGRNLQPWYAAAAEALGFGSSVQIFPAQWAEEAVIRGQVKILDQFNHKR